MKPVRLLELRVTYKWGGGPDKTILLSAEKHDQSRVSVVVVYIRDKADNEFQIGQQARARGLTYYEIEEQGKFQFRVIKAIREIILGHDINLVHSHDYKSNLYAYLATRWLGSHSVALMSTAHAWVILGFRGNCYRRLDLYLMKKFDHLFAVSHATKSEMVTEGICPKKISVIHNGIDVDAWSKDRAQATLRTEYKLDQSFPIIGFVGRVMPEKDLATWLRSVALVSEKFTDVRFVLVGEGRDDMTRAELESLANDLGITDRLIWTGFRSDLLSVYASFDVFLLTSVREGLPNSILEAMAMELPVVTSDVAGAKELVVDGDTGFVRPMGDYRGLGNALLAILENDNLRLQMGKSGRSRVESKFSFNGRLSRVESLYEQIVQKKQEPGL
jgi:glycosyltransferase involved in cell wall biosynthesis